MSIVDTDFLLSVVGLSPADLIPADLVGLAHLMVGQDDYTPYPDCGSGRYWDEDLQECVEMGTL